MFSEKTSIIISILVLTLVVSTTVGSIPKYLGIISLVIILNIIGKKVSAHYLEIETKSEIWDFQRYWFAERHKFSNPLPIGIVFPIILGIFTYGRLKWLAILQTDFKAKMTKKIRKKKGSFAEVSELNVATILFFGFLSNIILALLFFKLSPEIAKISLLYAFFNLVPLGKLDGMKMALSSKNVYFASVMLLAAVVAIVLIL